LVSEDVLESLIERLNSGDAEAIQQALVAHAGILRMMVRRQLPRWLRPRFDSMDIVQSVWAHLLPGLQAGRWHFASPAELRAFLVKVTRNRLTNRIHHAAHEFDHARTRANVPAGTPAHVAPPDEAVSAKEDWQQLLSLCPPAHRELLRLKRDGVPLAQIATRTGLHPSSVRRILYDLLHRFMARRQPNGPEDRDDL
jgi:RNA polymerase sigma-70 factor (ECF subfamily)